MSALSLSLSLSLSLHFNGHFPGEPGLAGVYWSKGWWRWWWQLDYWSYKSCKAPVKSSAPTNQHPTFYKPHALPVAQPTVSEDWREKVSHSMDLLTPTSPALSLTIKGCCLYWKGFQASCQLSDANTDTRLVLFVIVYNQEDFSYLNVAEMANFAVVWLGFGMVYYSLTSHSTQYRSFRRRGG